METEYKNYDVFLSYAAEDKTTVEQCYRQLKTLGLDIFFDNRSIVPGDTYVQKIPTAVRNSKYVLVFLSSLSYRKKWVAMEVNAAQKFNVKVIPVLIGNCDFKSGGNDRNGDVPVLYSYIDLQDISKIKLPVFLQDPLQYLPELQLDSGIFLRQENRCLEHYAGQLEEQCRQYRKECEVKYRCSGNLSDYSIYLPIGSEEQPLSAEIGVRMKENVLKGYLKIFTSESRWHSEVRKIAKQKLLECFADFLTDDSRRANRSSWEFFSIDYTTLKDTFCRDCAGMLQANRGIIDLFFASAAQNLRKYDEALSAMCRTRKVLVDTLSAVFSINENWYCDADAQGCLHYANPGFGSAGAEKLAAFTEGKNGFFELSADIRYGKDSEPEAVLLLQSKMFSFDCVTFRQLREYFKDLTQQLPERGSSDIFCSIVLQNGTDFVQKLQYTAERLKTRISEFFAQNENTVFERLEKILCESSELAFENHVRRIVSEIPDPGLQKYAAVSFDEKRQLLLTVKHPAIYFGSSELFPVTLKKCDGQYKVAWEIADISGVTEEYANYFKENFSDSEMLPAETSFEVLHQTLSAFYKKRQNDFFELYNRPVKEFCAAVHEMYKRLGLNEKNASQDECYAARCNFSMGVKLWEGYLSAAVVSPGFGLWDMRVRLSGNVDFMRLNDSVKLFLFNHLQQVASKEGIECEFIRKQSALAAFDMKLPCDLRNFLPLCENRYRNTDEFCNAVEKRIRLLLDHLELMKNMFKG